MFVICKRWIARRNWLVSYTIVTLPGIHSDVRTTHPLFVDASVSRSEKKGNFPPILVYLILNIYTPTPVNSYCVFPKKKCSGEKWTLSFAQSAFPFLSTSTVSTVALVCWCSCKRREVFPNRWAKLDTDTTRVGRSERPNKGSKWPHSA